MGKYKATGTTYKEVIEDCTQYLENPPMIALPGGTWCPFCKVELCRNGRHSNRQMLMLLISRLAQQIEDISKQKSKPHIKLQISANDFPDKNTEN
jgi:hypothetical protein